MKREWYNLQRVQQKQKCFQTASILWSKIKFDEDSLIFSLIFKTEGSEFQVIYNVVYIYFWRFLAIVLHHV